MTHAPTTIFTPATCATTMRAAAKRYDQDGRATADRAHALALPASATPDVHVASSGTSDPTPNQAMQRPSGYAQYVDRWAKVTASLDGLVGAPLPRNLRSVASIIEKSPRRFQRSTINRLGNLCDELIIVINACMPFDPDKARKTLHDKARLTNAASVCFACHSPGETKSGLCPEDYELQRYHLARGRHDFADLPSFARYVEDRIRHHGLQRDASPYLPEPQKVYEHDINQRPERRTMLYRCDHCGRMQQVDGLPGEIVGCTDCGHDCMLDETA